MPKPKETKKVTKSGFLRELLTKKPDLDFRQVNQRWAKAGHPGEISNPLYYLIRKELGIKTVWEWVKDREPETTTGEVYQLKITLLDTHPPIWRRMQVGDCTLDKLHEYIQTAMGWTNSHLHQFQIDKKSYGDPFLMQENFEEMDFSDSTKTLLSQILPNSGTPFKFKYEYDFGDGWMHEVLFERRLPADPKLEYPLCVEGARACPPEDCGGVWGYAELLNAINDRKHPEHDEVVEWVGGKFNPESFNAAAASRSMKQGLPGWR